MANENEKELLKLLDQINKLRAKLGQPVKQLTDNTSVKELVSLLERTREQFENAAGSATDLYSQLRGITSELKGQQTSLSAGRSAFRDLTKQAQELKEDEQGIYRLNQKQLESLKEKVSKDKDRIKTAGNELLQRKGISDIVAKTAAADSSTTEEDRLALLYDQLKARNETVSASERLTDEEIALVVASQDTNNIAQEILDKAEQRLEKEKEINDQIGVSGAALNALNSVFGKLGISSNYLSQSIRDSEEAMRDVVEAGIDAGKPANKLSILAAGFKPLGAAFTKTLFSAEIILGSIVTNFFEVNKAASELQQLTGQNSTSLAGFNSELVTSVQVLKTMQALTKQTGMNAQNIFTSQNLAQAGAIQNTLGLSAQEAGNLAIMAQSAGTSVDAINSSIVDTTSSFNRANRSAVSQGQVLRDVANTSEDIKLSLGNNPKLISEAASAARRLGMDLDRVDKIASSLMDFESSIEAELEAQLLTGKNINMAKARELALNNDLAGLSKEIFKNSADVTEFGKMNRIQQEAQAKALGISRQELGKMAYQRALEAGMTKEQAAEAANVKKEDMERLAVQEKLQIAATKLASAFAPMLEILVPIVDIIAAILKPVTLLVGGIMAAATAARNFLDNLNPLGDWLDSFSGNLKFIPELIRGIGSAFTNLITTLPAGLGILAIGNALKNALSGKGFKFNLIETIKEKFSSLGKTAKETGKKVAESVTSSPDKVKEMSTDVASKASEGTEKISTAEPKSKGEGIKQYLTNLAEGLKAMGSTKVLGGALNLIPASIGFVAFIPGAVGAKLMEYLNGPKLQESLTGLAEGLKSMGNAQTIVGALALIPASLGMIGLLPALPVMYALPTAGKAAARGLSALGKGLAEFGVLMMTGVGAIGLAAVVASIVAIGASLRLAAPAFEAFGNIIQKAFGGIAQIISATASGISQILDAITMDKAVAMLALGPALLGVSAGLIGLSAASLFAAPGIATLGALSLMAAPLGTLGNSLTVVAAGIAAVATALNTLETEKLSELKDLVMTTAVAAPMVAASGAITEMIAGIAGSSKKEGEGQPNADLINKIDELIAVVKQGGDVYIDGNKAGQALVLASTKLS